MKTFSKKYAVLKMGHANVPVLVKVLLKAAHQINALAMQQNVPIASENLPKLLVHTKFR